MDKDKIPKIEDFVEGRAETEAEKLSKRKKLKDTGEKEDPKVIWKAFLNQDVQTLNEFAKFHGYGISDIEEIGWEKFIDAMGWTNSGQIESWRTDRLHNVICPNCKEDFGILEIQASLCDTCKDDFYYELVEDFDTVFKTQEADAELLSGTAYFVLYEDFRELFRKNTGDFKEDVDGNLFLLNLLVSKAINDFVLTRTAQNSKDARLAPKGTLIDYVSNYKVKGKYTLKKDFPGAYKIFTDESKESYDSTTNKVNVVKLSFDLAIRSTKFVNEIVS